MEVVAGLVVTRTRARLWEETKRELMWDRQRGHLRHEGGISLLRAGRLLYKECVLLILNIKRVFTYEIIPA